MKQHIIEIDVTDKETGHQSLVKTIIEGQDCERYEKLLEQMGFDIKELEGGHLPIITGPGGHQGLVVGVNETHARVFCIDCQHFQEAPIELFVTIEEAARRGFIQSEGE